MVFVLCLAMAFPVSASAATKKWNTAVSKYKTYMQKHSSVPYETRKYYDINKDGTPEMIRTYLQGIRCSSTVYTIKNGKVKNAGKVSGLCGGMVSKWKGNKKYIVMEWSNGAEDSGFTVYKLKSGKLKKVATYRVSYNSSTDTVRYTLNGNDITRTAYFSAENKIGKSLA
jgi:hypothetical protein